MQSIRSKFFIWLLKNRHLLQFKLKPQIIDENFSVTQFREKIESTAVKLNRRINDIDIKTEDVNGMYGEWLIPVGAPEKKVILYIHGGGFISGSCLTHRMHVSKFAKGSGLKALVFDYRLAPEHPYPAALEDSLDAYKWLLEQGYKSTDIVIAGESAGGSLTLAVLVAIRDQGLSLPKAAVSISPCTDLTCSAESFKKNAKRDIAPMNSWSVWTGYYVGKNDPSLPWLSPLNGDLNGLPPILLCVGSSEIHLDDTRNFAVKAKEAGVETNFKIWEGMIHAFPLLSPFFPEAKAAMDEICIYIKEHLSVDK